MFNRLVAGLVMGALLGAGEAGAEGARDVPLKWQRGKTENTRVAFIPGAKLVDSRNTEIGRLVHITYDDGTFCSSASVKFADLLTMSCGTADRHYLVVAFAEALDLSWVADAGIPIGKK